MVPRNAAISIDIFIYDVVKVVAKLKNAVNILEDLGNGPNHHRTVSDLKNQLIVIEALVDDIEKFTNPAYC